MRVLRLTLTALALPVLAGAVSVLAGAALAQRLPETSRAEQNVNAINRSLNQQSQGLGAAQQNQFEVNQLRGEIQRGNQFPTVTGPRGCGPGAVGC